MARGSHRFKVTLLVNDSITLEHKLAVCDQAEAVRRALRWSVLQVGTIKQGQTFKAHVVKVEPLGEADSLRRFQTRPMGMDEAILPTDKIRIPTGTKYRTARPGAEGRVLVTKKTYITVTAEETAADADEVFWRGSGGYTCWTVKDAVERVIE